MLQELCESVSIKARMWRALLQLLCHQKLQTHKNRQTLRRINFQLLSINHARNKQQKDRFISAEIWWVLETCSTEIKMEAECLSLWITCAGKYSERGGLKQLTAGWKNTARVVSQRRRMKTDLQREMNNCVTQGRLGGRRWKHPSGAVWPGAPVCRVYFCVEAFRAFASTRCFPGKVRASSGHWNRSLKCIPPPGPDVVHGVINN